MKTLAGKVINLSVLLALVLFFGQAVSGQENECVQPISISDIAARLKSDSRKGKNIAQINEELINEIVKRKVIRESASNAEKTLKKAGANALLLKAVRENPSKYQNELGCLYQKYIDNYRSSDPEQLKIALEAAKEFVRICEKKIFCNLDQVQYFKEAIAALEEVIKSKTVTSSKENECPQSNKVSVGHILSKFRFTSRITHPAGQINKQLIAEIAERKVNFQLNAENEKMLREAGASDLLIKAVSENYQPGSEIETERLYNLYVDNYQSEKIENLKIALDAAKEYIRKFENDGCNIEVVKYFKDAVLVLEEKFPHPHPPVNPKNELKWKLLSQLEKHYKAKNWREVFALGEKVLEIDPEFTPLLIVLAGAGFDQAKLKGEKSEFNDQTIRYAELAIKLLETEKETKTKYGALDHEYKTKAEAMARMKEILDFMKSRKPNEKQSPDQ